MKSLQQDTLENWLRQFNLLNDETASIEKITRLDLSAKGISTLPEEIGLLTNLVSLNLSNNKLTDLPSSMKSLKSLTNLDMRRNLFETLPSVIGELSLRALNLGGNKLTDVSVLKNNNDLRVLDLSANLLTCADKCLAEDSELRSLNLSFNLIKDIKNLALRLSNLERINLNGNLLEAIPSEIGSMQSLEVIEASDNEIAYIDEKFFDLELESIDLSSNSLTHIKLYKLENLELLTLDENPLSKIEFNDDFAPYLKEFSCDSCQLEEFFLPPSKNLHLLCYSSNHLKNVPEQIGEYVHLSELDIDKNFIIDIPDSLANLLDLNTLYVEGNLLSEEAKKIISILDPEICDIKMKSGITIEKAQKSDLPDMAHLLSILFRIESDFEINYNKQLSGITTLFNAENTDLLVAKHEGSVIGMVTMQRLISSAEGDFIGQIEDLVVKDEYRKMGVGSRLINKIRYIAQEYEYKRIQLAADINNDNALRFYSKRGFRRTNLTIHHF